MSLIFFPGEGSMPSLQIYQFEKEKTSLYHTGHLLRGRRDVTLLSIPTGWSWQTLPSSGWGHCFSPLAWNSRVPLIKWFLNKIVFRSHTSAEKGGNWDSKKLNCQSVQILLWDSSVLKQSLPAVHKASCNLKLSESQTVGAEVMASDQALCFPG